MRGGRRSWWGWGYEDRALDHKQRRSLADAVARRLGLAGLEVLEPARLEDLALPRPRVVPPASLERCSSTSPYDRASHTYGQAYIDVVRAFRGELEHPPDVVVFAEREADVVAAVDWASSEGLALVPFGGGSSVVGGVSCEAGAARRGAVSVDLSRLDRVLEVDATSRAARIEAGIFGPALEERLRPHGLTLRHFPQSFECSSLGGWLATRSGGHYATGPTRIDDFVESLRAVTPAGVVETRRLPASGAGPAPEGLLLGSEGTLGVITEAWMRLQLRPRFRASAAVAFARFPDAVEATRQVVQAGLRPANCRLLDRLEAATSAGGDGHHDVVVLGFESADHPVATHLERALELARTAGGVPQDPRISGPGDAPGAGEPADAVGTWRRSFLAAPYVRDALVAAGVIAETFETACTWDAFFDLHAAVTGSVTAALREVCGTGSVTCRFTHVYPDGPAPYFTVLAPGRRGAELTQWAEVKAAASEAIGAHGGTITHHHAVGRTHRRHYEAEVPAPLRRALAAAKDTLDPAGVMNPGVLFA